MVGKIEELVLEKLPPIYVITCSETPDREAYIRRHLMDFGLTATFFYGLHGKTWGLLPHGDISSPAAALILSQWALWQALECRPAGESEWIILQDDAILPPMFRTVFSRLYRGLQPDWQFVYLGHYAEVQPSMPFGTVADFRGHFIGGLHAYMVRRSALRVLIDTNKQLVKRLDRQVNAESLPQLNVVVCQPSLIRQLSADGDIESSLA